MNRSIDRIALGHTTRHSVARSDVVQVAAATKDRLHVALLARFFNRTIHVLLHLGIGAEIALDQLLGLPTRNLQSLAQTKGRNAIDDTEIGRLGTTTLLARNRLDRLTEEPGRRRGMDILPMGKGGNERLVAREVSHQAQLDLAVIDRQQQMLLVRGDKGLTDAFAQIVAHGDILQVRVGRRETSRSRNSLIERRMNTPRSAIDQQGQCLHVGR